MNVKTIISAREIQILINDLPHIMLLRTNLIGIQSYNRTSGASEETWYIEFEMKKKTIISNYDKKEIWSEILKQLSINKIFDSRFGENIEM